MSSPSPPPSPPPPVSSLRSRFEQLAAASNGSPSHRPRASIAGPDSLGLRRPAPPAPRRVVSASHSPAPSENGDDNELPLTTTRSALSRPVPAPPSTTSKPAPPIISVRPTLSAPPTLSPAPEPRTGGVASLRSKFNSNSTPPIQRAASPVPPALSPPPIPQRQSSVEAEAIRRQPPPAPRIAVSKPAEPRSSPSPPPLPTRSRPASIQADSDSGHSNEATDIWSRSSSETSSSSTCSDTPPGCDRAAPPPVPARPGSTVSLHVQPPPLPSRSRQAPPSPINDMPPPPRLPLRPPPSPSSTHSAPPTLPGRSATLKATGHHLPPPPMRVIAPGAPLPAVRRTSPGGLGSSSDSEDDLDEPGPSPSTTRASSAPMPYRKRTLDDMPDASLASRRAPCLQGMPRALHVPAHTGVVAMAGSTVLVASTSIRIYELSGDDAGYDDADAAPLTMAPMPATTLEMRDLGLEWRSKDHRVTAAEFRPALTPDEDDGRYCWLGTRDGHLLELDVWTRRVVDVRPAIHSGAVTSILRGHREMVSVDENGKALRWAPGVGGGGMMRQSARLVRLADKTGFVALLGGWLWSCTNASSGASSSTSNLSSALKGLANGERDLGTPTNSSGFTLRVYDMRGPVPSSTVLPTHDVGPVTCGAMMPSQPGLVFLGHEGGFVSIWSLEDESAVPQCVQTLKISMGDVLCLEGIGSRLWAGARNGTITAYDTSMRPWRATNVWKAHGDLPVLKLTVDVLGIAKCNRLAVASVGRDEQLKFWDGLLGADWVDAQLLLREHQFCTYRGLRTLICTWNVDAAKPDALTGSAANVTFLESLLSSVDSPDIIVFGFQELIDLEDRSLTAKNILLGGNKKKADGSMSGKVSKHYKLWHDHLVLALRVAMPATCPYTVVHTENLVGLFTCIFVKSTEVASLRDVAISTVKRGLGGRYGNKGAIAARFVIDDSSICFVNCHLAAGQNHVKTRNADVAAILEDKAAFPVSDATVDEDISYVGGGDGSMVLDHEICFLNGDLNYRIDQRRDAVISYVHSGDFDFLVQHDQLLKEMHNPYFRLRVFREAPITFAPTYKYDRRSDSYDTSEKRRAPAWCDRVLVRCREQERVHCIEGSYRRWEVDASDHRPVSAAFDMTVKKVHHEARERERRDVFRSWETLAQTLLGEAQEWYVSQGRVWLT